jgi:two-component system, NtrC family, sensor histidine kinase HydH
MECDRYEVLSEIARIAAEHAADPPRSIKELLRFLAGALSLDELTFSLFDPRLKIFFRTISSSGPDLFLPCAINAAATPAGNILRGQATEPSSGELHLPVGAGARPCGVLTLRPAPAHLRDQNHRFLLAVCHQLAFLSQTLLFAENEQRRRQQLSLMTELGRDLSRAVTLHSVQKAAIGTIRKHTAVACIILRPLHGGTVLGRSQVWIAPTWQPLRTVFLELEEKQTRRALASQVPLIRQGLGNSPADLPSLPPSMVTVPLFFQDRQLGSLTLFGGDSGDVLPFRSEIGAKRFFTAIGSQIGHALERVTALERLDELSAENDRKLREATLLFRIARAMHSTLRLNELMHLILSAAAVSGGGGFERAMLFMLNERSGILQGMLCVSRETASLVLPAEEGALAWEHPVVTTPAQEAQRKHPCSRQVMQQRLPLQEDNALARAARMRRVVFVAHPGTEPPAVAPLRKV